MATRGKSRASGATAALAPRSAQIVAFDAGKSARRLKSLPTSAVAINTQIRQYGKTILARSRYLACNNSYAAAAKETFVSALVGCGIKPSSLAKDGATKAALQEAWLDWTDEADADGLTDLYGMQAIVAAEMFEAGECFIRFRPRRDEDGLSVPLQLQILPAEMLPLEKNENATTDSAKRIEMGIEFNAIGQRTAYHFFKVHPGSGLPGSGVTTAVPASEVLHLFRPVRAGQVRGIPHTLSAIVKLAILDQYDDAELERKRIAALFAAFIIKPRIESDPMGGDTDQKDGTQAVQPDNTIGLQPGATFNLELGEDVKFAEPADVGGSYEVFQYRQLLAVAAGFGVPYAAMTGDLKQANYGSIRAGLVDFRRRVEAIQHSVMVFQFCRPVWQRWLEAAVLAQAIAIGPADYLTRRAELRRVKWITPAWPWIDPLKDRQAEKLAVDNGYKARSDVIEAEGSDPEETDARIKADKDRADSLGLVFAEAGKPTPQDALVPDDTDPAAPKPQGNP